MSNTKVELPEGYTERVPAEELDLVSRMHGRFKGTGLVMPESQRKIYKGLTEFFKQDSVNYAGYPKRIYQPTVVDVGCGCGIGSNIMSQETKFVWGIDMNEESIAFAKQMFERVPNNIYFTPQVSFDVVDATDMPREMMKFDYVVCVEVIEHLPSKDADKLVAFLNRLVKPNGKVFITSPNRNNEKLQDDTPYNEHHCYEATPSEMYAYLTKKYKAVTLYNEDLELQELSTKDTPLVFKCEQPIE